MPLINSRVILDAWIGTDPRCPGYSVPQVLGFYRFCDSSIGPIGEMPIGILVQGFKKIIGNSDAIIGILSRYGLVGFAIPVGVILMKGKMGKPVLGICENSLNIRFRNSLFPSGLNSRF